MVGDVYTASHSERHSVVGHMKLNYEQQASRFLKLSVIPFVE